MENNSMTQFKVIKGGPMEITGHFTITGHDGKIIEAENPSYLCRCGSSGNKPFCDETHIKIGFKE